MKAILLCGGKGSRIGIYKHLLIKEGMTAVSWWQKLFQSLQIDFRIACKASHGLDQNRFPLLLEEESAHAPLHGIVNAISNFPNEALLVVAVDLLYCSPKDIVILIQENNPDFPAICYEDTQASLRFPLLTLYQPQIFHELRHELIAGNQSARNVLSRSNAKCIDTASPKILQGINTISEYQSYVFQEKSRW